MSEPGFAAVLVTLGGLVDRDSSGGVGDPFADLRTRTEQPAEETPPPENVRPST